MTKETLKSVPLYDRSKPIACSVAPHAVDGPVARLVHLREVAIAINRREAGVEIRFANTADTTNQVHEFVTKEMNCCPFWGFATATKDTELTLKWDGPPATAGFMDCLVDYFEGTKPIGSLLASMGTEAP